MNEKSQREAIARHLRAGKSITALQALARFQCLRLSGRIYELKAEGLPIIATMVKIGEKRVARYSLAA